MLDPVGRFRARRRADDGDACQLPRQLHQHGTDAAGRADHEQRLARQALVAAELQAVEQQFPGCNGRERQGGGRSEIEAGRHVADDALVDQLKFAVAAGTVDGARVPDFISYLEQGDVGADGRDDASRIPAQHFRLAFFRRAVLAHLGVDGIDGNGLDGDEQVAPRGDGHGQLDVEQGVGIGDGQAVAVGDGFHVLPLLKQ